MKRKQEESMSRSALVAEVKKLQDQLMKANIIAATRLDVIRLLGFVSNRDPVPNVDLASPKDPTLRKFLSVELTSLASHLRNRADAFDKMANDLTAETEKEESEK